MCDRESSSFFAVVLESPCCLLVGLFSDSLREVHLSRQAAAPASCAALDGHASFVPSFG